MELRWHQTYTTDGVDSAPVLQYREEDWELWLWEDVPFVREREEEEQKEWT
jgi:hypothetical protein